MKRLLSYRIGVISAKYLLSVVGVVLMLGAGCGSKSKSSAEGEEQKISRVKIEVANEQELKKEEETNGNVESFETVNVAPQIAGRIEKIYVEVGDHVRKGQKLADMDSLQYLQTKIQLQNIMKDSPRMKALRESGAISEQQYDQHQTNLDVTTTALKNLANNITLYSPVDGIVTGKYFENKELFVMTPNASGSVAIVTVMQINPVKVFVNVSETFYPMIKLGMKAGVKLDLYPGREFAGSVYRIHPTIDATTRTFVVEVVIPNASEELKPGMFARVNLDLGQEKHVVVSDVAVLKQSGTDDRYVFVLEDGMAVRKNVKIGRRIGDKIEILSGLNPGETVIVAGHSKLQTNTKVEVVK